MAGRRRGGFAFDLFQPLKKGVLLKQGAVHTAFKYRFFVLYPGFFVYYEKESKWRQDLTKGETLDVSYYICDIINDYAQIKVVHSTKTI